MGIAQLWYRKPPITVAKQDCGRFGIIAYLRLAAERRDYVFS